MENTHIKIVLPVEAFPVPKWVQEHLVGAVVPFLKSTKDGYLVSRTEFLKELLSSRDARKHGCWFWFTYMKLPPAEILIPASVCEPRQISANFGAGFAMAGV